MNILVEQSDPYLSPGLSAGSSALDWALQFDHIYNRDLSPQLDLGESSVILAHRRESFWGTAPLRLYFANGALSGSLCCHLGEFGGSVVLEVAPTRSQATPFSVAVGAMVDHYYTCHPYQMDEVALGGQVVNQPDPFFGGVQGGVLPGAGTCRAFTPDLPPP